MSIQTGKMCRTCLVSDTPLLPLFDKKSNKNPSVIEMLQACNFFQSNQNSTINGMPDKICLSCISEINRAYLFKIKCERSDETLKQLLEQEITSEDIYDDDTLLVEQIKNEIEEENSMKVLRLAVISPPTNIETTNNNSNDTTIQNIKQVSDDDNDHDDENVICFDEQQPDEEIEEVYEIDDIKDLQEEINVDYDQQQQQEQQSSYEEQSNINENQEDDDNITVLYTMTEEDEDESIKSVSPKSLPKIINRKKPIKCSYCPQEFVHLKNYQKHVARHISNRNLRNNKDSLLKVKPTTTTAEIQEKCTKNNEELLEIKCTVKENDDETIGNVKDIINESEIKQKIFNNTPNNSYKCHDCGAGFRLERSLAFHIKLKRCTQKQFECLICKKVFISKNNLLLHMKIHTNEIPCTICNKKFTIKDEFDEHMNKEHQTNNDIKNQCTVCKKVFTMLSALKDHMRIHSGEKPFLCSICGKGFSQNTNLKQHVMRHSKLKPFKCQQCSCKFVSKGELNSHIRKHTGEHPFVCDTCGSGFTTSSSLLKHKRIHTGERPYACEFCPMRFAALGTMKNHRRTHTGEKPFVCKVCKRGFSQQSDCAIHMRTHTGERPYVCSGCGLSFQQSGTMKTHFRKIHADKGSMEKIIK